MRAIIDDNLPIMVTDWQPWDESRYRAQFYFDPNSISMYTWDAFSLLSVYDHDGAVIVSLEMQYYSGSYQISMVTKTDVVSTVYTPSVSITDAAHMIEFDWKASDAAGVNNGWLNWWVDNEPQVGILNIDNDQIRCQKVSLGAVSGIDNGTRGSLYIDSFVSRRSPLLAWIRLSRSGPFSMMGSKAGI